MTSHHEFFERCLIAVGVLLGAGAWAWLVYVAPFPVDIILTACLAFVLGLVAGRRHP
jgi:hypothetical protein